MAIRDNLNSNFNFSTKEKKCGIWIDGKTLYKRTFTFTNTTTTENFITDILSSDVDIIFIDGNSFCNKWVVYSPVNTAHSNTLNSFGAIASTNGDYVSIGIRNGSNGTGYNYFVTLMYTKK